MVEYHKLLHSSRVLYMGNVEDSNSPEGIKQDMKG